MLAQNLKKKLNKVFYLVPSKISITMATDKSVLRVDLYPNPLGSLTKILKWGLTGLYYIV